MLDTLPAPRSNEMAKAEIPNKLLRSYTGTRFVFSA
jgi:hypothetical protein